jgi:DNA-binding response OmpR family regulator
VRESPVHISIASIDEEAHMSRILLVHHDLSQIMFFRNVLTHHRYEVVTASDYGTAIEIAQKTPIQLVFFSLWLRGITGIDLAHTLRTLDSSLPLVVLLPLFDLHRNHLDALNVKSISYPFESHKIVSTAQMYLRSDQNAQV